MTDSEIMSLEKALFILRHGSAEGEHKYFEAIGIIENEIKRQQAEIERYKSAMPCIEYQDNEFCGVLCGFAEDIINRKNAEIERLKKTRTGDILVFRGARSSGKSKFATQKIISVRNATVEEFVERIVSKAKSAKERFLLESLVESAKKEMGVGDDQL